MSLQEASQQDGCVKAIVTADSFKITFVSAAFESAYGLAQSQVVVAVGAPHHVDGSRTAGVDDD